MWRQALGGLPGLTIVAEVDDPGYLPVIVARVTPDWLIVSPAEDGSQTGWWRECLTVHPELRILTVRPDGGGIEVWSRIGLQSMLVDPSLDEVISLLHGGYA
jgi:hypothetical protein